MVNYSAAAREAATRPRPARSVADWAIVAGFLAAHSIIAVEQLQSDRLPVAAWGLVASVMLAGLAVGIGIRSGLIKLAALGGAWVIWAAVVGFGATAFDAVFAGLATILLGGVGLALGSAARRILARSIRRPGPVRAGVGVGLVAAVLPYPVALVERHRTISVTHPAGRVIDERTGTFRGVGLGDSAAAVTRAIGRPVTVVNAGDAPSVGPTSGGNLFDGPSSLDVGSSPADSFVRYAHDSFQIRAGRVRSVQINDHGVASAAGIGPGDSVGLVRRAYPAAVCGEGAIHGEPDYLPYPECRVELGRHRWLTFFGTYRQAGAPVVAVWMSTGSLEQIG